MNDTSTPFQEWVETNSSRIFALAYRITGQVQDAEEVVQETFLKAYQQRETFKANAAPGTWLYRIASNCALDLLRKRKRQGGHPVSLDDLEPLTALTPDANRSVEGNQFRHQLNDALKALTPMERAAFILRHYEAHSCREVGEALGCNTNRAKQAIFRAVQKLRKALKPMVTL